jgi:hemerythrin-like domain-containing protein
MPTKRQRTTNGAKSRGTDATALLIKDHKTVKALLKKLENSDNRTTRTNLLKQIENELKIHTQIEEEIFYPAYKNAVKSEEQRKLYYEAMEEHHVVDLVLPEIKDEDAGSEQFAAKAKVLKDLVEHHAEEEETEMFPKARRAMGTQQLKELGTQLQERKQQLSVGIWDRAMEVLKPLMGTQRRTATRRTSRKRAA